MIHFWLIFFIRKFRKKCKDKFYQNRKGFIHEADFAGPWTKLVQSLDKTAKKIGKPRSLKSQNGTQEIDIIKVFRANFMFQNSKVVQQYYQESLCVLLPVWFIELAGLTKHSIVNRVTRFQVKWLESFQSPSLGKETFFARLPHTALSHPL